MTYWSLVIGVSIAMGFGVHRVVVVWKPHLSVWPETIVSASIFTLLYTPMLYATTLWFAGENSGDVISLQKMAFVVFLVPLIVTGFRLFLKTDETLKPGSEERPRLMRRLGDGAGKQIMHMRVRDHYVDVFTEAGSTALLMRFSDAIAELEGVAGLRVHRSYWVALEAVKSVERQGARIFLLLKCGARVPVSRGYQNDVAAAGLI
ncbi:MAG: LytTR family transcriptional regulator [Rhodobacteraceae bacterium]|nr:LytTR family transcriptional regulator [Paracoccaceae bacterium]